MNSQRLEDVQTRSAVKATSNNTLVQLPGEAQVQARDINSKIDHLEGSLGDLQSDARYHKGQRRRRPRPYG